VVRDAARQIRKGQTGNMRNYAGILGIGAVLLLGWFVLARGVL
jgi:NADH-quinone oxidoreductase subunit L